MFLSILIFPLTTPFPTWLLSVPLSLPTFLSSYSSLLLQGFLHLLTFYLLTRLLLTLYPLTRLLLTRHLLPFCFSRLFVFLGSSFLDSSSLRFLQVFLFVLFFLLFQPLFRSFIWSLLFFLLYIIATIWLTFYFNLFFLSFFLLPSPSTFLPF